MPDALLIRQYPIRGHAVTLPAALDLVVARTGVERYRYLCLEHESPRVRRQYSDLILRLALEPPPTRPTPTESLEVLAAVRRCPFRSVGRDGCQCGRCALRGGAKVATAECIACVKLYPVD
jgi:hypothetical protein